MRNIMYTVAGVQCSVFVGKWQGIAPNGRLGAISFSGEGEHVGDADIFATRTGS